jgi:hypothetical protein
MNDFISRRNTASVELAMKALVTRVEEQQIRIDGLMNTNSTLAARIDALEMLVRTRQAASMGSGPTVK